MGLVAGDVISVTYNGEYANQQIRNVLHYRAANNGSSATPEGDLLAIAQDFANPLTNPLTTALQDALVDAFAWTGITTQRVSPTRTIQMTHASSWPGAVAGAGLPPNVAAVITKRTQTPGRKGVGSLHLTGIDAALVTDGVITNLMTFDGVATEMLAARTVAAITCTLDPVIYNPTLPPFFSARLFDTFSQDTIRVMRRRTVRVGI